MRWLDLLMRWRGRPPISPRSLRSFLEHLALAPLPLPLPRLSLHAPAPTCQGAIRVARRADQISTLEATVQALLVLEGPSFGAAALLEDFGRFVAGMAPRQRPAAGSVRRSPALALRDVAADAPHLESDELTTTELAVNSQVE